MYRRDWPAGYRWDPGWSLDGLIDYGQFYNLWPESLIKPAGTEQFWQRWPVVEQWPTLTDMYIWWVAGWVPLPYVVPCCTSVYNYPADAITMLIADRSIVHI